MFAQVKEWGVRREYGIDDTRELVSGGFVIARVTKEINEFLSVRTVPPAGRWKF